MNTLGSSKVHEKEVYSLWVILDHPVVLYFEALTYMRWLGTLD